MPALRASDAERERVADFLRERCGEGRLGLDELSERLDRAYAGRTGPDLAALVADLPGGLGVLPGAPVPRSRRSPAVRVALVAGLVLLLLGFVAAAATAPLELAVLVALLAVIVVLLVNAVLAALPALALGWVVWQVVRFVRRRPSLRLAPPQ